MRILLRSLIALSLLTFSYELSVVVSSKNVPPVTIQTKGTGSPIVRKQPPATVQAAKRENPHVNFEDGRTLNLGTDASRNEQVAMVSADFDSDGIADVVTADTAGNLQLLKGLDQSKLALNPATETQARAEPFIAVKTVASLGFSPDSLFAGDFNADGKADIIGAANGAREFVLVTGDGRGHFSLPVGLTVNGTITAMESGEIGRPDGQTDLALAYNNKDGNFVAIYEHPESAFKHPPEIYKLPAPANAIAIGNMDEDSYSDVAVACDSDLVVIHGRGQAYPWDIVKDSGIKRPPPVVETREMPSSIVAMTVGRFSEKRGSSLALLGSDGSIVSLGAVGKVLSSSKNKVSNARIQNLQSPKVLPTGFEAAKYGFIGIHPTDFTQTRDGFGKALVDYSKMKMNGREEYFSKQPEQLPTNAQNISPAERAATTQTARATSAQMTAQRKAAFMQSISAHTSALKDWSMDTLTSDSQFAAMTVNGAAKLLSVNVSDSNLDDLMVTAKGSPEIQMLSRQADKSSAYKNRAEVSTIASTAATRAVLPMRLNLDGMDDLVVLRDGAASPSVVLSAPQSVFVVTNTNDDTVCDPGGQCSLRGAILAANATPGNNIIVFAISSGVSVINLQSELPVITHTLSIQGGSLPNGTKMVEINGAGISGAADGLKIRASNCFIWNLAINNMPSGPGSGGSAIGGNGITIESTSNSPNNGHNFAVGLYLGTDATGAIARPNKSTGMLIFDSDNNSIGGAGADFKNVMSGNNQGGYGLDVTAGNSNVFLNNIIGLNAAGTAKLGNNIGVLMSGADNQFGGDNAGDGNTVSGNGVPDSSQPQRFCRGGGLGIVDLYDAETHELLTQNITVRGNRIGTDPTGTIPLGNCYEGIYTTPLSQTTIGSITEGGRNVIADNGWTAIRCIDSSAEGGSPSTGGFCGIAGNNIGTDITGTVGMGNDDRNFVGGLYRIFGNIDLITNYSMSYFGAPGGTTPGGACTGFCNLYSGNAIVNAQFASQFNADIYLAGFGDIGAFNNSIGVNRDGHQALPNRAGIVTGGSGNVFIGGVGDDNGTHISLGNAISGQKFQGLSVTAGFFNGNCAGTGASLIVQGNKIGTDVTGTNSIPNGTDNGNAAVSILRGYSDTGIVGGEDPLARNIISGNAGTGLTLGDACVVDLPIDLPVSNNLIGVNVSGAPLGNAGDGISVSASLVQIGGSAASANEIAYNGNSNSTNAGVTLIGFNGRFPVGVNIRGNSIHDNIGLGIDLGGFVRQAGFSDRYLPDGVTENDCQDQDTGPNDLQNYPLLDAPVFNGNGTVTITGALLSRPFEHYTVDFFASTTADPTGHGEGEKGIGSIELNTDEHGLASINFTSSGAVSSSNAVSAIATDTFGSTSEFSCNAGATCSQGATGNKRDYVLTAKGNKRDYKAEAAACFTGEIVVNIASDEPDDPASLSNNICDAFPDPEHPDNQCSLRAAIQLANQRSGLDTIIFDIPGNGVHTITPTEALPEIKDPVTINATSQHGYSGEPLIELTGMGLVVKTNNSTIRGFTINHFDTLISIEGSGNKVQACYLGLNPDGVSTPPNSNIPFAGIKVVGDRNAIGGDDDSDGNVISGNINDQVDGSFGIWLLRATRTIIRHNKIGTDKTGMIAIPNGYGIQIDNGDGTPNTGTNTIEDNLISGNGAFGIANRISSDLNIPITVSNNVLGGNADGSGALPNLLGGISLTAFDVTTANAVLATIQGNTIVGHTNPPPGAPIKGINILGHIKCNITDNFIGITKAGKKIPNDEGISINQPIPGVTIGAVGHENYIAGNLRSGIHLSGNDPVATTNVKIIGNFIGINATNTNPNFGNGENGIFVDSSTFPIHGTEIARNVISGNGQAGILLSAGSDNNQIHDNQIGASAASENPVIPNHIGIKIQSANNQVNDNILAGNQEAGIAIVQASSNKVFSNAIVDTAGIGILLGNVTPDFSSGSTPAQRKAFAKLSPQAAATTVEANEVYSNRIERNQMGIALSTGANNNYIGTKNPLAPGFGNTVRGNTDGAGIGIFIGVTNFGETDPDSFMPSGNKIVGNHIGENSDGEIAPNRVGVVISHAINNLIGGVTLTTGASLSNSIVASQEDGIRLAGFRTRDNLITNNYVGASPTAADNSDYGNGGDGVNIQGGTGRNDLKLNIIGWNHGNGISVASTVLDIGEIYSSVISGNQIGVLQSADSITPMGNTLAGIHVSSLSNLLIGVSGDSSSEPRNIIASNGGDGILLDGNSRQVLITNSVIGTTESGTRDLGNGGQGIYINGGEQNTVGGTSAVGNIIAGNKGSGVNLVDSALNKIYGNLIGIAATGLTAGLPMIPLGNGSNGISIFRGGQNTVGGDGSFGNLIGGNQGQGVDIEASALNNLYGNQIGVVLSLTGQASWGNHGNGVFVAASSGNQIGGSLNGYSNFIGGNGINGLVLTGGDTQSTLVKNNFIGTDRHDASLGNFSHGVLILNGAQHNTIGGTEIQAGNTIAHNGGAGVALDPSAGPSIVIDPNLIYQNAGLGIDLNATGTSQPNDPGDADSGPNNLQNYPEFSSAVIDTSGNLILRYKIDSDPGNSNYGTDGLYVEFFKADSSSNLQGQIYLGNTYYTVANFNGSNSKSRLSAVNSGTPGTATFNAGNAAALNIHVGDKIVATATDADGNTSEFTGVNVGTVGVVTPTAADGAIKGMIVDGANAPVAGVTIKLDGSQTRETITDAQGAYHFEDVETNGFYTITPARVNYAFTPASRSFSLLGSQPNASFTANADGNRLNPLDETAYFVRQQYLDFLNREPDEAGFNFWVNNIESCGSDAGCREVKRINTSSAFLLSIEFQRTGFQVIRMYQATFIDTPARPRGLPRYQEFRRDSQEIGRGVIVGQTNWQLQLSDNTLNFARAWVQRPEVLAGLPDNGAMADQFVDKLFANCEVTPTTAERSAAVTAFGAGGADGRARALLSVTASGSVINKQYNQALVLMQYAGYLRRNPNDAPDADYKGFDFWQIGRA